MGNERISDSEKRRRIPNRLSLVPFVQRGFVTDGQAWSVYERRGGSPLIAASCGRTYQVYDTHKLELFYPGPTFRTQVRFIHLFDARSVIVGTDDQVSICNRSKVFDSFEPSAESGKIIALLIIGDVLLALTTSLIYVLRLFSNTLQGTTEDGGSARQQTAFEIHTKFGFGDGFTPLGLAHPPSALNKVLVYGKDGCIKLYNFRSSTLVHTFKQFQGLRLTTISAAPLPDIMAVGTSDGKVTLWSIASGKVILSINNKSRPSAVCFRYDNYPIMAVGDYEGRITVWNLESQKVTDVRNAHMAPVSGICFRLMEPVLFSYGCDNAIRMWIFDSGFPSGPSDGPARLLKERSGHQSPPVGVSFYGSRNEYLLSHGLNEGVPRLMSIYNHADNFAFSAPRLRRGGNHIDTLSPIIQLASSSVKELHWDNIVTCQQADACAQAWNFRRRSCGKTEGGMATSSGANATSVAISACGNYAFIGCDRGHIDMYNLQSGKLRKRFGRVHDSAVTSIFSNMTVSCVFSTSLDSKLVRRSAGLRSLVNDPFKGPENSTLDVGSPITTCVRHESSGLAALLCDDGDLRVVDCQTMDIARVFRVDSCDTICAAWRPDGRKLLTSNSDLSLRIWDITSGLLSESFNLPALATSLAVSDDFIVTTQANELAISLWVLRESSDMQRVPEQEVAFQTAFELLGQWCLSSASRTMWHGILHLDRIRDRNQTKSQKTDPSLIETPFFLPMEDGLQPKFVQQAPKSLEEEMQEMRLADQAGEQALEQLLSFHNYPAWWSHIKKMSPAGADLTVRLISSQGATKPWKHFIRACEHQLELGQDFDIVQAILGIALRIRGQELEAESSALRSLLKTHERGWFRLRKSCRGSLCILEMLNSRTL